MATFDKLGKMLFKTALVGNIHRLSGIVRIRYTNLAYVTSLTNEDVIAESCRMLKSSGTILKRRDVLVGEAARRGIQGELHEAEEKMRG